MTKRWIALTCLSVLLSACGGGDKRHEHSPALQLAPAPAITPADSLLKEIQRVQAAGALPGVSAVLIEIDTADIERSSAAVAGLRQVGGGGLVQHADQFQTGSMTKAATAMLIARLVEQNKLRWDSTLAELIPEAQATMHPAMRGITVEQLLRHRGGFKHDLDGADFAELRPHATGDAIRDRATIAHYLVRQAPAVTPGSAYAYSNLGYMLAGFIAEKRTGLSFAALMQQEVFAPLQMQAAMGFPEDAGSGAMTGHVLDQGRWSAAPYTGDERYYTQIMAPAGGMMVSMSEFGKLLQEQLRGMRGKSRYLSTATFQRMHQPQDGYALGWSSVDDPFSGRLSVHAGSWGTYYTFSVLAPGSKRAVAVSCNCYGDAAVAELDKLVLALVRAK